MYMNNHMHKAPQSKNFKEKNREEK